MAVIAEINLAFVASGVSKSITFDYELAPGQQFHREEEMHFDVAGGMMLTIDQVVHAHMLDSEKEPPELRRKLWVYASLNGDWDDTTEELTELLRGFSCISDVR